MIEINFGMCQVRYGKRKKIREEIDFAVTSNGEQGAVIPATSLLHRRRRRDYGEEKNDDRG